MKIEANNQILGNGFFSQSIDQYILYLNLYLETIMLGKCDNCGMENVEVTPINRDSQNQAKLCNQCRPPDGAYGY
jgi:hypothetical protein